MSQDPLVGSVLGGARLIQRVSKGLMAHVYQGHYERLGIPVAVKVLSPKATSQGVNRERFVREGRALAQLSHANIIKIYNVGHENGRFFIIMDWIQDGMNLRQLAQTRPLTPAQSLKVVQRLCEALEYIHQRNLIHRDLKPANVCLRRGGHPVLMDFSLIKDQKSDVQLTAPGTIMGTVNFMPPEQAQPGGAFGNVSPRSDVYSLGGTGYWLLTGKPPFKGRTPMETIIKLMREQPAPPSTHNPSLPKVVDELILSSLAKHQQERPASAREFAERIEFIFQNHREELNGAQRPNLAEGGSATPQASSASGSGSQPKAAASSSWGSSSSQGTRAQAAAAAGVSPAQPQAQPHQPAQSPAAQHPGQPGPALQPGQAPQPGQAQPGQLQPGRGPQAPQPQPAGGHPGVGPGGPLGPGPGAPAQQPQRAPAAAATATAPAPQASPQILGPPAGLSAPEPRPGGDEDFDDPGPPGGGGVFVPSMSTEGAAAGLLQLPDELREDKPSKGKPSKAKPAKESGAGAKRAALLAFLVLVIAASVAVAVAVFVFEWKPF